MGDVLAPVKPGADLYRTLGMRPIINAAGDMTRLGGTLMLPEVRAAMLEAAQAFVAIEELEAAAGRIIATITGAEAGYVTAGAAAALALSAAACIARDDPAVMDRLPDATKLPHDIVLQVAHRDPYDRCLRVGGARLVLAGSPQGCTRDDLATAIGPETVALAWWAGHEQDGLDLPEVVAIAHARGLPVIVDAAASLPPVGNLTRFIRQGADLVIFSGGKALRGPQASGILAGKASLIRSVALQHQDRAVLQDAQGAGAAIVAARGEAAQARGVGRPMKVGKEEIVGAIVALQQYVQRDHAADQATWAAAAHLIIAGLQGVAGVEATYSACLPNRRPVPCVHVAIDASTVGLRLDQVEARLQEGTPRIFLAPSLVERGILVVNPANLQTSEASIVANCLRQVLRGLGPDAPNSLLCR